MSLWCICFSTDCYHIHSKIIEGWVAQVPIKTIVNSGRQIIREKHLQCFIPVVFKYSLNEDKNLIHLHLNQDYNFRTEKYLGFIHARERLEGNSERQKCLSRQSGIFLFVCLGLSYLLPKPLLTFHSTLVITIRNLLLLSKFYFLHLSVFHTSRLFCLSVSDLLHSIRSCTGIRAKQ